MFLDLLLPSFFFVLFHAVRFARNEPHRKRNRQRIDRLGSKPDFQVFRDIEEVGTHVVSDGEEGGEGVKSVI